ncbi:histidinol dehydrogenase [Microlunatus soli]|uniref:histidinol dehydrogenase n=1 Tax=Microlunatus soli TaxID=630515 RepID=UPI001E409FDF|nr:histidinol dehydrogenase [Microlunatus soli]
MLDNLQDVLPRAEFDVDAAVEAVRPICEDIARHGEQALTTYAERFDHVVPASFRVPVEALSTALAELDPELRRAFEVSIERRRAVSLAELGDGQVDVEVAPGARVSQRMIPVDRVGLYVPGGVAPLASTVIMNVVPAQIAGVGSLALASTPQQAFGGLPHPSILALCALLGVDEVYAVGGSQAVPMFAYGVPGLCPKVDMITGPGNIYTVAAKRLVKGLVGIDSEAGPTEIAILADDTAVPAFVAADLISQSEHDPAAASVLITDSEPLIAAVEDELKKQVATARHAERIETSLTGQQSGVVLVDDLEAGIAVADAYAAEHLEIQTRDAAAVSRKINNAGAIFLGSWSPVSLGDYSAGSTHVLPTAGCACHSSGLNVKSYLKAVHVIDYDQQALAEIADHVVTFAEAEDLPSHGRAISIRQDGDQ